LSIEFVMRRGRFGLAARIFAGPVLERADERFAYGEARILAIEEVDGMIIAVIYTDRGEIRRIISSRRANRRERAAWFASL
jgi:uncharacterized DUF497 family protein